MNDAAHSSTVLSEQETSTEHPFRDEYVAVHSSFNSLCLAMRSSFTVPDGDQRGD